jgi:hypothetical protein
MNRLAKLRLALVAAVLTLGALAAPARAQIQPAPEPAPACTRVVTANVVALDQVFFWNRLGAVEPQGMIYALEDDVVHVNQDELTCPFSKLPLSAGQVKLRRGKRPRPLALRVNAGDCLDVRFRNLLAPNQVDEEQPATREASVHVVGMQYRTQIEDGGMWVGNGPSGQVPSGGSRTYRLYAEKEGTFLMYSGGAVVGGEGDGGSISAGLFGAVHVQSPGSRYFRSQVTQKDLGLARTDRNATFPSIDYTATYPAGSTDPDVCAQAGRPILEMTQGGEIVHSDLTAIITGPDLFSFTNFPYPTNDPTYPHRNEPFREFTIIFHDEIGAVQAFPQFQDRVLSHTLQSVRDAFAINYGTGGIGAEILANRLGVGPMHECIECKYEEFFLASWVVGDPAMVVDRPANYPCGDTPADWQRLRDGDHTTCTIQQGPKATKAFYPDDPSNVYHSYMNDRVKFRNLHAGSDDHHIFHLHAHQWLHTPKSTTSNYLDSQAIGQGSSFTYEITYEGSGNVNKTVGDSIFHCHFYPHFAQGMWSLWRVHDVLELGTELDEKGRPLHVTASDGSVTTLARALPDGEIAVGTPIPAIVPLPGKALPPPPTPVRLVDGDIDRTFNTQQAQNAFTGASPYFNPGYPFFVPGRSGHRAPHPPLDFAKDGSGNPRDGGLPRHVVDNHPNELATSQETRLDFSKEILRMLAIQLPEQGTVLEDLAMRTHETSGFTTPSAGGPAATRPFELNGAKRQPGAPYADPCYDRKSKTDALFTRHYEAVDLELDVIFNKAGWHFPQQRLITLRNDMAATLAGTRPPEPFFFRANSGDCIEYELTNLVPNEYRVDDFQVRTPTDILGQHIHLVKFDVTSSDGGSNGFNYEDGTFSPEEVQERIEAVRALNGCPAGTKLAADPVTGALRCPEAEVDPRFGTGPDRNCNERPDYLGAQTTVQRWWADPVRDHLGNDRTLRTIFTHDHFGPSTHQQAGLYAGLVVEPAGSQWYHNEQGYPLYTAADGSPTTWQARIVTPDVNASYREFLLEYADFQLAYEPNQAADLCPDPTFGYADPANAINPAGRKEVGPPLLYEKPVECPVNTHDVDGTWLASTSNGVPNPLAPCPEAVSADDPGMWVVNYRNEPLALRIGTDPNTGPRPPVQVLGTPGDPSFAYETRTDRANPELNKVPDQTLTYVPYPALTGGLHPGDPFTPVMRVYEGDRVQIRTLVGAHEEEHNFSVHGLEWRFEPFDVNSGYRNSQMAGISEWFDFIMPPMPNIIEPDEEADFLVKPNSSAEGQWSGVWALLRLYEDANVARSAGDELPALESNPDGRTLDSAQKDATFEEVAAADVQPRPNELGAVGAGSLSAGLAAGSVNVACPSGTFPPRPYDITAVAAREVLPVVPGIGRTLVYNRRNQSVQDWSGGEDGGFSGFHHGPLHDPTAIVFVYTSDLDYSTGRPRLLPNAPVEPLILRAKAGECVQVTLRNDLPDPGPFAYDLPGYSGWLMLLEGFNANQVAVSREVGLHPQLVAYDMTRSDGANVGRNPFHHGKQTVAPGQQITYYWYAGEITQPPGQAIQIQPIEYGSTGLASSDTLEHSQKGAIGALIVEPAASSWQLADLHPYLDPFLEPPRRTRAEARVTKSDGSTFRELVTVFQDDVNLRYGDVGKDGQFEPVENLVVSEDPTESGQKAFGYRTEPVWYRKGWSPDAPTTFTRDQQLADVFTDSLVGDRPVTHIFDAEPGDAVRFRTVHPGGHTQNHVFEVQGHLWPELPYLSSSTVLGFRTASEYQGTRHGVGPTCHYDALLVGGAGGKYQIGGEYLYRDYDAWGTSSGLWGLFNVEAGSTP